MEETRIGTRCRLDWWRHTEQKVEMTVRLFRPEQGSWSSWDLSAREREWAHNTSCTHHIRSSSISHHMEERKIGTRNRQRDWACRMWERRWSHNTSRRNYTPRPNRKDHIHQIPRSCTRNRVNWWRRTGWARRSVRA